MKHPAADLLSLLGDARLSSEALHTLAFETGFFQRAGGKIHASDMLIHLCLESMEGTVSYNDLAARIEAQTGISASRQAYWEKTTEACLQFFQRVLERLLRAPGRGAAAQAMIESGRFTRIVVQDSTVIQLPRRLFQVFSGVRNAHTTVCNARIQGTYNLLSGRFLAFSIDAYSQNDLAVTRDLEVEPGDLVLRDRGYFTVDAIAAQKAAGADSINRYKHQTTFFDPVTGEALNLLALLTQQGSVDRIVLAGTAQKMPIRLVAVRVNDETANVRRMKAKRNLSSHAPSADLLTLMSWSIFLTTLTAPDITFKDLLALYGLRWRIENIFKTWKSHFSFAKVHTVSERQLRILLTARLIMITLCYQQLYLSLARHIHDATGKHLSLMKLMRYLRQNLGLVRELLDLQMAETGRLEAIGRYCTYEKRTRVHFMTSMEQALAAINPAEGLA
jgi:hypothetical protein